MIYTRYLGLAGIFLIILAIRVIRLRWKYKVPLGSGDTPELEKAVRVFGNFTEYTPLFFLLLFATESSNAPQWLIHCLGSIFLVGRLSHSYGITKRRGPSLWRFLGMSLSFLAILVSSVYLISQN